MKTILVGGTTLLVRCARHLLERGHEVTAIVSQDVAVRAFAAGAAIPCHDEPESLAGTGGPAVDVLFSIANLRMLSGEVLSMARMALNFHDGPLPRYAGLNAPQWALLDGEATHGITWHIMEQGPDTGDVAFQARFGIDPEETAATLNAKCYEAAFEGFQTVVRRIEGDALVLLPQAGARSYFGKYARPGARAFLDPSGSRGRAARTVCALDTAPYPNPLEAPKLMIGEMVLCIGKAQVVDVVGMRATGPGHIACAGDAALDVMFADGPIRISGLRHVTGEDVAGRELDQLAASGARARGLDGAAQEELTRLAEPAARAESHWMRRFKSVRPVELPYARRTGTENDESAVHAMMLDIGTPPRGDSEWLAATAAWIHRLTGETRVTLQFRNADTINACTNVGSFYQSWRPALVDVQPDASCRALTAGAACEIGTLSSQCPPRADLCASHPELAGCRINAALSNGGFAAVPALPRGAEILVAVADDAVWLVVDGSAYTADTARLMASHFTCFLGRWSAVSDGAVRDVDLVPADEAATFAAIDASAVSPAPAGEAGETIVSRIRRQIARTPGRVALQDREKSLTYAELDAASDHIAARLGDLGCGPGHIIGVCQPHTADMAVTLLAILKAGAAYLPLDPAYPAARLADMLEDSGATLVIGTGEAAGALASQAGLDHLDVMALCGRGPALPAGLPAGDEPGREALAYLIYTSGSTGRPKGVQITQANAVNFFRGMDERIAIRDPENPGTWLSVTTVNFDISVLELLWTLTRGFTVAMHARMRSVAAEGDRASAIAKVGTPSFSLFYFANAAHDGDGDAYRLLLEGARFADREGFEAVWTPERHFHEFGGLYPNPALTSAAVAAVTQRVAIRAGSCVAPLHHPVRIAEDWSVVDNLSNGRAGIAFAAGWNPNDFVLQPDAFADAKKRTLEITEQVRRLWRGEALSFENGKGRPVEIRTLPRPRQAELPTWLTAARNPETFAAAGRMGVNVLTHMLGMSLDEVASNIRVYRDAWAAAGHAGEGRVTLMLHTFVGDDDNAVRDIVRAPMKAYLAGALDLVRTAAWSFPTIRDRAAAKGQSPGEVFDAKELTAEEHDALLEHAFSRYYETSGLFGTSERCLDMVASVQEIGVDEIACLIDFGIEADTVLNHLPQLKAVMQRAGAHLAARGKPQSKALEPISAAEDLLYFGATYLQCTPSMATMLAGCDTGRTALARLDAMLVGGEALPRDLALRLRETVPGQLLNMYGPTETTIWSSVCDLERIGAIVPLGEPIANTSLRVRTPSGADCPAGVAGELCIGGDGVSPGYWRRPELNGERFFGDDKGRFYRTGDLVRRHGDGTLEFLGRIDQQVKIRGHRIELGEIQAAIETDPAVERAVVVAREAGAGDVRLVAYCVGADGSRIDDCAILAALGERLPAIMVPSALIVLDRFPYTPNGKIDVKALPSAKAMPETGAAHAPEGDAEKRIAAIWCELLEVDVVDVTANFFDVGGHSLLAVQAQRRIAEAFDTPVSITDMFRFPTVRQLAARIAGRSGPELAETSAAQRGTSRAEKRLRARGVRRFAGAD